MANGAASSSEDEHGTAKDKILAAVATFIDRMHGSPHLNGELKLNNKNGKVHWALVPYDWNLDELN